MEDFRDSVKRSFSACKSDIESLKTENFNIKDKVFLLEQENQDLKEKIVNLTSQISDLNGEIKGLSIAINYIKELNEKIVSTPKQETPQVQSINQVKEDSINSIHIQQQEISQSYPEKSVKTIPQPQDPYEALLAFKAKANKREVLKQKMLTMISETGMNLSELNFMFVKHFKYCSRATFYNYLKELELEKKIRIERENSKNFVYLNDSIINHTL